MKALNPKYQSKVNRAIKYLLQYNQLNDARNKADGNEDQKLVDKLDKQCNTVFNKYLEIVLELPKREMINIEKSEHY